MRDDEAGTGGNGTGGDGGPSGRAERSGGASDGRGGRDGDPSTRTAGGGGAAGGFRRWVSRPEVLVGLAALILSLCGLFISIHETMLVRQEQRASVWPYVELGTSVSEGTVAFWAGNTGVGPARVRAVAVQHRGETEPGWEDLLASVADEPVEIGGYRYSLLNGRVLPPGTRRDTIFELEAEDVEAPGDLVGTLYEAILDGAVDVTACYCSVYDECWTSSMVGSMQGRIADAGTDAPAGSRRVESCEGAPRSGI